MNISESEWDHVKNNYVSNIELLDLLDDNKPVVYISIPNTKFEKFVDDMDYFGLEYDYYQDNQQELKTVAISKDYEKAKSFLNYEQNDQHSKMGKLLGYPDCCIESFNNYFDKDVENWDDKNITRYEMKTLDDGVGKYQLNRAIRREEPVLLYHFPCSLECEESLEIGDRRYNLLNKFNKSRADMIKNKLKSAVVYNIYESSINIAYCYNLIDNENTTKLVGDWWSTHPETDQGFINKLNTVDEITHSSELEDMFSEETTAVVFK